MMDVEELHAAAVFLQECNILCISGIKVSIPRRQEEMKCHGDSGTCRRRKAGMGEPIRKKVSRGARG